MRNRNEAHASPGDAAFGTGGSDLGCGIGFHDDLALGQHRIALQPRRRAQRRAPPLLLAPGGHREVRGVAGLPLVQHGQGGAGLGRPLEDRHQPTAPSICSSISRFSSSAYSIGSSRAMGSTKPRTMVAAASSSVMPRLIR
jgi:hypothetical protein